MPKNAYQYLLGIIEGIVGIKREGLLSLGFFLAIFFASSGMLTLMYGFDKSYEESFKTRGYFKKRLVAVSLTLLLSILFIPSLRKRIPFINPGSILATILSILTSYAFSYFINNFGRYNELYGSIGALIVIMLWLQFNAFVILIGYELMASIAVNRDLINGKVDE